MAFTIPDNDVAGNVNQSIWMSQDIAALVSGFARTGVVSGCAVTAQGTPNMTVAVAAGVVILGGQRISVASGNVTITTADATNPRIDIVVVNSSGTKSATAGTAAANPKMPAIPGSSILLAAVYVPASDTTIDAAQITDKRVVVNDTFWGGWFNAKDYGVTGDGATDDTTAIGTFLSAVSAAGGGVAYFPKGTYLTTQDLSVFSNLWVRGDGIDLTTIKLKSGTYTVANGPNGGVNLITESAAAQVNITITDLTLDANQAGVGLNLANQQGTIYGQSHTIDIRNASRVVIERIRTINPMKYSIHLYACTDVRVSSCFVVSGSTTSVHDQQDGIHITNSQRVIVSGNNVDTGTTGDGDDCIITRATGLGNTCSDITIVGNMMRSAQRGVALVSDGLGNAGSANVTNIAIAGNTVWGARSSGVILNYYSDGGIFQNITISGNSFEDIVQLAGGGHGINVQRPPAGTADGFDALTITGNAFNGMTSTTNALMGISRGKRLVINANVARNIAGSRGIALWDGEPPVVDFNIANNTFDFTAAASGFFAMLIGKARQGTITGNTILGHTTGTTYGLWILADATNGATDLVVANNRIDTFAVGISENNSGANPDNNIYAFNNFRNCTTALALLGAANITDNNTGTSAGFRASQVVYAPTSAGSALASSVTETNLITGYTIPAGGWRVGQTWRIRARGVYGDTGTAPTLTLKVKIGSVVACSTAANTVGGTSLSNRGWWLDAEFTVVTVSSTGTVEAHGMAVLSTSATAAQVVDMENTATVGSINMTGASNVLTVSGQWGTSNASNTIQLRQMTIEVLN